MHTLERKDLVVAATLAGGVLALYASTACRTFYGGDSAELAAAVALFGVPHPPGYPLFTLATGFVAALLPWSPAFAANLATAFWGSLAVGSLLLLARRFGASRLGAVFAAASFGVGQTWWSQCVAAEVYSFDVLLFTLALHASLGLGGDARQNFIFALALGLWLGHRPINVLYLPAILLVARLSGVMAARPVRDGAWRPLAAGVILSASVFLYLPLASNADPAIDVGDPETWDRFWTVVRGAPYGRHWFASALDVSARRMADRLAALPVELGLASAFAVIGGARGYERGALERSMTVALGGAAVAGLAVVGAYAVLDVAVTFLPATVVLAVLAARGIDSPWSHRQARIVAVASPLALGANNLAVCDLRSSDMARRIAEDTLASAEPNSALFVGGDTVLHGVWYLQAVEKVRTDVLVVSPGHISEWYLGLLAEQHPSEIWPPDPRPSDAYVARLIESLASRRKVFVTGSLPVDQYLKATGTDYGLIPRGLLTRIARPGERFDRVEAAAWSSRFFESAAGRLTPAPDRIFPDDASMRLLYATSAENHGELFERLGDVAAAERFYARALAFEPHDLELIVSDDVARGLGESVPELLTDAKSSSGLERLRAVKQEPLQ